jgi:hypothetical protein
MMQSKHLRTAINDKHKLETEDQLKYSFLSTN